VVDRRSWSVCLDHRRPTEHFPSPQIFRIPNFSFFRRVSGSRSPGPSAHTGAGETPSEQGRLLRPGLGRSLDPSSFFPSGAGRISRSQNTIFPTSTQGLLTFRSFLQHQRWEGYQQTEPPLVNEHIRFTNDQVLPCPPKVGRIRVRLVLLRQNTLPRTTMLGFLTSRSFAHLRRWEDPRQAETPFWQGLLF
jgi:hypothetical protein